MDRLFAKDNNETTYRPAGSFVGNRSFISTQFSNDMDYEDMKKSKIHNLPNHRKTDLGDNLPFVVVFQTIEIERLSEEIESNRVRIKDFQRQVFNAQNYEVQIRELTEKCFSLESGRSKYAEQTQKLNLICHQLYSELQQWKRKFSEIDLTLKDKFQAEKSRGDGLAQEIERLKSRYMATQKSKVKELDDLRQLMESQRKSVVDREIREVTLRFQTQRGALQNQIRKLREGLDFKNRELEQYREKCQKLEIGLLESQRAGVIITELENKVVLLTHEISRLTELLKQKQDEIDEARRLEFKLCQQLKEQQQWEFQNKQLKNNLENRVRQIQDWRVRCGKLDDQLTKVSQVTSANQELTTKVSIASREIERLNSTLQGRVDEIENWKQKLARQEVQTNRYRNLEIQMNNYQNKIVSLAKEIERLNIVLKTRLGDIEDWKSRCSKMQVTITNYGVVESDNRSLQTQVEEQGRHVNELKNKLGRYEIQIANLKMVEGRLSEADKRNIVLNGQVDRLNGFLRGKTQENQDLKTRHSKIESTLVQYRSIQTKLQKHESTISNLTQQLERLNDSFRVKGDQCDRLTSKIRGYQEQIIFLKTHQTSLQDNLRTINTLNQTVADLKRGLQAEQDKSRGLQTRTRQQENTFVKIQQDKDRLGRDLKQKSVDLDEIRSRYGRLEQQIYQLKEVQAVYRQTKNKLAMTVSELERTERTTKELGIQLEKEKGLVQSLKVKINMLGSEAQKLKSETGLKSKEYIQLKDTFLSLQKGCRDKDNEIVVLNQKMSNIQKQLGYMTSELQRFLNIIGQYQQKAQSLQQDIVKYQDYAKRIHILGAEMDRLTEENRRLEEDISKLRLRYANNIAAESRHENQCLQFVMLFVEIESLRARLTEKESQADQIRKSVLEPIRNLR